MSRFWRIISLSLLVVSLSGSLIVWHYYPQLRVLNGYAARTMCSCYFEVGRNSEQVLKEDLGGALFAYTHPEVDTVRRSVTSSVFGLAEKTALYVKGSGCLLIDPKKQYTYTYSPPIDTDKGYEPWILASSPRLDQIEMDSITRLAFDPEGELLDKKTRALLIFQNDSLIYEKYARGTNKMTPLLGWSMTKSVLNTLCGILEKQGQFNLEEKPFTKHPHALFAQTTLRDLLQMRSGLEWEEKYDKYSSATQMLFDADDAATLVAALPFEKREWEYSSGTSNLLSGVLKKKLNSYSKYRNFPYVALFHPLDLENAWIETDAAGTYLTSSYMYATARDWLKLGILYLNEGEWKGQTVLTRDWIRFTKAEAPGSDGRYGAHFWLNLNGVSYPDAPQDMYTMDGYQGQLVAILPSHNMVMVRLGLEDIDFNELIKNIVNAVEN